MKNLGLPVLILILTPNIAPAQTTYNLEQMRRYFKEQISDGPYIYLQSPRTGMGIGTVYMIFDKQTIFISRPEKCFPASVLEQVNDKLTPLNFNIDGKYSWQVGLKVADAGPITQEVNAELKKKGVRSLVLKMPELKRRLIDVIDLKRAIRSQIDSDCKDALDFSKKPERWIILEVLYTDHYSLQFEDEKGTQVGIKGGILKILFPSFNRDSDGDYKGSLEFSGQEHIVAIKAVKLKDVSKMGAGDIEVEPAKADDYYAAIDRP